MARLEKADADLEQLLYFRHHLFVDDKDDHMVIGFDHGVDMADQQDALYDSLKEQGS